MPDDKSKLFQFPQLYAVEASAGSGKTYCLARRYLQLLINPYLKPEEIPLDTILAITFTNKAALEMKERILDLLKRIALNKFPDRKEEEELLSSLGVDETYARQKAFRIMDHILKNYNFFQVQTIDSFINAILSGCAFKLGLSANFTTEREYREYLVLSLDKLIERAHEDKEVLAIFHNFLRQYIYLENAPGWFPKQNIMSIITSLYSKSARFSGSFIASSIKYGDILALKKDILSFAQKLKVCLPEGTDKRFIKALSVFLTENKENFDIDEVSTFFKREELPLNKSSLPSAKADKLWQRIRERLQELAESESLFMYNYYIDIFNAALLDLEAEVRRDDILFLEALNKEAAILFQEKNLNLPELYWRLATRFGHFLLDEFQDTSGLQWENLNPMVKEALSTSGSLFFVGDKKQAIYRFRGGETGLIGSIKKEFGKINFISESLTRNFRSQRQIVEFNNLIFSRANLERFLDALSTSKKDDPLLGEADKEAVLDVFSAARQEYLESKPGGFVLLERSGANNIRDKEAEARERLIPLVKELTVRFNPEDIAILVRKNDEAALVTSWFLGEGIPVESETTLDIRQNPYIKELVSFLRFLNSPIDNLSFASFILGDIFSRASGLENIKIRDFIFDLHRGGQARGYLYREFRQAFPEIWDVLLEEFFRNVGFVPLYELMVSILGKLSVLKEFPEYQAFFMGFLELIRRQEEETPGITGFLEFFSAARAEELYVNSSSNQAIKVLTIHKAKGLEFPVVIVPFLEINIRVDDEIVVENDLGLTLLYSKKSYADFSPRMRRIRSREYLKALTDELNAVYVALTRAAHELYLFVPEKGERGANIACGLFTQEHMESGERTTRGKDISAGPLPIDIPVSEYKDWIHLLRDEFVEKGVLRWRDKVQRGEILHYILSCIGNLYKQDKKAALEQALELCRARFPLIEDFAEFKNTLQALLSREELRDFFEVAAGNVFTEKEIVNRFGDTKRIDRLVITPVEAIILDYKSEKEEAGDNQEQVREYIAIIREIYPKLKVRGLLLYLDDLSTEEIR
ncbi:MAG: UvrD-helicase domain-containing protein [Candidatus Omnitrophica bacterium]|nr:UvrD-helicase domain-containing protein [Candidatus Omnitrophota bacterium]